MPFFATTSKSPASGSDSSFFSLAIKALLPGMTKAAGLFGQNLSFGVIHRKYKNDDSVNVQDLIRQIKWIKLVYRIHQLGFNTELAPCSTESHHTKICGQIYEANKANEANGIPAEEYPPMEECKAIDCWRHDKKLVTEATDFVNNRLRPHISQKPDSENTQPRNTLTAANVASISENMRELRIHPCPIGEAKKVEKVEKPTNPIFYPDTNREVVECKNTAETNLAETKLAETNLAETNLADATRVYTSGFDLDTMMEVESIIVRDAMDANANLAFDNARLKDENEAVEALRDHNEAVEAYSLKVTQLCQDRGMKLQLLQEKADRLDKQNEFLRALIKELRVAHEPTY